MQTTRARGGIPSTGRTDEVEGPDHARTPDAGPGAPPDPVRRALGRGRRLALPDGRSVTLRPTGRRDRHALTRLYALCAPLPITGLAGAVSLLSSEHTRDGVLALAAGGRPVAWSGLVPQGSGTELVLLCPPAWTDRGLADALVTHLLARARAHGMAEVHRSTLDADPGLRAAAARVRDLRVTRTTDGPWTTDRVFLPSGAGAGA
ncbi:hypothetical protein ACN20G_27325 (plasmid) [Streptomyces sp. BI20]|uniref:hypothetical protein n=1 Tax=Streptomyces sp. BI20 TaxID=3403460 RepID=UPI003C739991